MIDVRFTEEQLVEVTQVYGDLARDAQAPDSFFDDEVRERVVGVYEACLRSALAGVSNGRTSRIARIAPRRTGVRT